MTLKRPEVELSFKGMTFTGFLDTGFLDMDAGVPYERDAAARRAERQRIQHHRDAVVNLWRHAISTVEINHPNPGTRVEMSVGPRESTDGQVYILFRMYALRDNNHPDKFTTEGFQTFAYVTDWPGLYCAQVYLAGMWSVYLMHEAQELVVHKGTPGKYYAMQKGAHPERRRAKNPVVDPHESGGFNQKCLLDCTFVTMMGWALGADRARAAIENSKAAAMLDLTHEIDYVSGKYGRWE